MGTWEKVYEEPINDFPESVDEYKIWLNEMLDDESIPYKNEIREQGDMISELIFDSQLILEIYVYSEDVNYVRELIESYNSANFASDHDELNVTEEDLNYEDEW